MMVFVFLEAVALFFSFLGLGLGFLIQGFQSNNASQRTFGGLFLSLAAAVVCLVAFGIAFWPGYIPGTWSMPMHGWPWGW